MGSEPSIDPQRVESILDSLDEGVITLSDDGTVIGINRAACDILDVEKGASIERACPFLLGDEVCSQSSLLRQSIADRKPIRDLEVQIRTATGQKKTLNVRTNILRSEVGGARGGLVIFRDITELSRLRRDLGQRTHLHNIIGKSKAMQAVFQLTEQVAQTEASVLIEGETGTGKELVARAIHHLSHRSAGPFIAVNCSALPETLLESELFGHVEGAFTGAVRDKIGRFQAAEGGTIFLDEVGDISPAIQVKLLRVLQERTIERVGDQQPVPVDIRVISATNRALSELVQQGRFRQDLLYRLRVVPVRIPALRERRDDIPLLAQHFVNRFRESTGRPIEGIDEGTLALVLDYHWPGNVRELENAIEYAFVKAREGLIAPDHLPPELHKRIEAREAIASAALQPGTRTTRRQHLTPQTVADTLEKTAWNISKAARKLNVSRTTLYKRITEYGLENPDE